MGIWDQLNTRTLFGSEKATAQQVNRQEKDIHLEEKNRSLLADVNLINKALMRDGSPIPATGKVEKIQSSDSGTKTPGFNPNPGEVWELFGFGIIDMAGRSGSVTHDVMLYDGTNYSYIALEAASSNSFPIGQGSTGGTTYPFAIVDENLTVVYTATGTFTTSDLTFTAVRTR